MKPEEELVPGELLEARIKEINRVRELEAKVEGLTKEVEGLKGLVEYYKSSRDYYMDKYLERSRPEPEPERAPTRPPPMTYQYEEGIGDLGAGEFLMRTASR
jgi:hypothetical protein